MSTKVNNVSLFFWNGEQLATFTSLSFSQISVTNSGDADTRMALFVAHPPFIDDDCVKCYGNVANVTVLLIWQPQLQCRPFRKHRTLWRPHQRCSISISSLSLSSHSLLSLPLLYRHTCQKSEMIVIKI